MKYPIPSTNRVISSLQRTIFLMSVLYTLFDLLFTAGSISYSPSALFNWKESSLIGTIARSWIISCIIPYPFFSWDMISTFVFLSLFVTPVASFTMSYMGTRRFIGMWIAFSSLAGITMLIASKFTTPPPEPFSLTISVLFGIVSFWTLISRSSTSHTNVFFIFPISTTWFFIVATLVSILSPLSHHSIPTALSSITIGIAAYIYGVTAFRLSSNSASLLPLEEKLRAGAYTLQKIFQWRIMRIIREISQKYSKKK